MMRAPWVLLVLAMTAAAAEPAFDVASLKAVQPVPPFAIDLGNTLHGKVTLSNVTLSECLRYACKIYNDAQIAGPDWIKSRSSLFSIVGQASPDTSRELLRQITLTLLTERFQMALHHEQRELPYLAMVADKKGPKLSAAKQGADNVGSVVRPGRIIANNLSMTALAVFIARFTDMPVQDMTKLPERTRCAWNGLRRLSTHRWRIAMRAHRSMRR
ncbi:conserved exported hypothetical protein [Candidatus Sulfopaludibacter sp. SbA3]|nr:conserved exported hypothetical protein [Candidatus Sulfopaludibacter sp. SbA3]